jgi:hypothetical protein
MCGACGNNVCNGGSGEINGEVCQYCSEAFCLSEKFGDKITEILEKFTEPEENENTNWIEW